MLQRRFRLFLSGARPSLVTIHFHQLGNESIPKSVDRLNVLRRFGIVTESLAEPADLSGQSIFSDVGSIPDRVENLFLLDHPVAVLNQEKQQPQRLGFELNHFPGLESLKSSWLDSD